MEPDVRLEQLRASGFPIEDLTPEQRAVLAVLTAEELAVLTEVKHRLDEVAPEVVAHQMVGGLFF
ncbi:aroma-sacti cluster domain-containing protein [Kitasatospora azatica]|uniref:aroma-sacti cluster domain-containing protein n=1 Tax=Kitasatospora azatica TaxID=58347 RepID=UPI00056005A8|nr:aroma-sacti cluster domain-containing protein [Kitasatospora azatica]